MEPLSMWQSLLDQKIIFVGGKGGVGKTTTAASLAYQFSKQGYKVLIISTDPAHSLGDAFAVALDGDIQTIAENLDALELDLDKLTEKHFERISHAVAQYTKPDMRPRVNKQLMLAKDAPGGQEAALLETICQYLIDFESLGYDKLIFDTAPTGHTLRLLVLPEMMSAWTDGLIHQQKKQNQHKAAALKFWQREDANAHNPFANEAQEPWQKALGQLEKRKYLFKQAREKIHDESLTAIVLVMVPEKLPLFETMRTLEQFKQMQLRCSAVVINQVIDPSLCEHDFWKHRYQLQQEILAQVYADISPQKYQIPLQSKHIVGFEKLAQFFA